MIILLVVIVGICITFVHRVVWWSHIDAFFMFIAAFLHLMATFQPQQLQIVAKKLSVASLIFTALGILALIGEAIAFACGCAPI